MLKLSYIKIALSYLFEKTIRALIPFNGICSKLIGRILLNFTCPD